MLRTSSRSGLGICRHQSSALAHPAIRRAVLETLEPRRLLASVPITNAGFENPTLSDGQSSTSVPGWTLSVDNTGQSTPVTNATAVVRNPSTAELTSEAPEGQNVARVDFEQGDYSTFPVTLKQTLSTTLAAGRPTRSPDSSAFPPV